MATALFEGVFDQSLLKTAKMTVFDTFFQLCTFPSPTFCQELDYLNFPSVSCLAALN